MGLLNGRIVVVTGAARGLGEAMARALAHEGSHLAVLDVDRQGAQRVSDDLAKTATSIAVHCDVTDPRSVAAAMARVESELGGLDVLVNNAQRFAPMQSLEEYDDEDFDRVVGSGLRGTFHCMRAAFPLLRASRGKVVNVASPAGIRGYPGWSVYAAAKEGIRGLSRSAANDWGAYGINVNVLSPSATSPGFAAWAAAHPENYQEVLARRAIKRDGDPYRDVARAVVYLAGPDSDFVTGQTLSVDGGAAMGP